VSNAASTLDSACTAWAFAFVTSCIDIAYPQTSLELDALSSVTLLQLEVLELLALVDELLADLSVEELLADLSVDELSDLSVEELSDLSVELLADLSELELSLDELSELELSLELELLAPPWPSTADMTASLCSTTIKLTAAVVALAA
jgi:hypothetical protein